MSDTRTAILETGVKLWADGDEPSATAIAALLGLSQPAIHYHFKYKDDLRNALALYAVQMEYSRVIVQLIATRHPAVINMPNALKRRYLSSIL